MRSDVQRQVVTSNGAVTFIGNSLGLNKRGTNDEPGTSGSIGTFITTNTNLRDNFAWPPGTTEDWRQNSSAAVLNLPPNSRVVYAELIWGGSYLYGGVDVRPFLDDPVEFRTPDGLSQVAPAVATRFIRSGPDDNYYGRSANVTALVTAGGNGTYTVGRVPATQGASEVDFNAAGWTLAVLYEDSTLPARNLSLFVGLEKSGGSAASLSGFCTPTSGAVRGRVAVSAIDGDTQATGDSLRFAPNGFAINEDRYRLAGPNNPITNFFASQINGDNGLLVTSGTFGMRNNNFFNSFPGGRQGWDITSVDASSQLTPGQTTAFARGSTNNDAFFINALALQIDVGTPAFNTTAATTVSQSSAEVGNVLTYTVRLNNSGGSADANNVTMTAPLPAGMSFVAGSLAVDGVPIGREPGHGCADWQSGGGIDARGHLPVPRRLRASRTCAGAVRRDAQLDLLVRQLRRAAITERQLHREHGDDDDCTHRRRQVRPARVRPAGAGDRLPDLRHEHRNRVVDRHAREGLHPRRHLLRGGLDDVERNTGGRSAGDVAARPRDAGEQPRRGAWHCEPRRGRGCPLHRARRGLDDGSHRQHRADRA